MQGIRTIAISALLLCLVTPAPADVWLTREAKLVADDAAADDHFGRAVSVQGDMIAAASSWRRAVHLFELRETGWVRFDTLEPFDTHGIEFGADLDIDGDRLIVGASRGDGATYQTGAAYLFRRTADGWRPDGRLIDPEGHYLDRFGKSVGVSGPVAVAGASRDNPGSVHVFRRGPSGWTREAKLTAFDAASGFGGAVAVHGDVIAVGAGSSRAVYVYQHRNGAWRFTRKLTEPDSRYFGYSVDVSADFMAVGAIHSPHGGKAFVYRRVGALWVKEADLEAGDNDGQGNFGISVAVSGSTVVVGRHLDATHGRESGSAYVFRREGTTWVEVQKLTASDAQESDFFGDYVAIDQERVVVGSPSDDLGAISDAGSVYVYDHSGGTNHPPIADAGPDTVTECDAPGTGSVELDGSASTDPDSTAGTHDDITGFEWREDLNTPSETLLATGETVTVPLALGTHLITLQVTDTFRHVRRDDVVHTVVDTTAPSGRVQQPAPGSCHGPGSLQVVVAADLTDTCDTALDRVYDPPLRLEWKLEAEDASFSDGLGESVAADGDFLIAGAKGEGDPRDRFGAAYVFRRLDEDWQQEAKLRAEDFATDDEFGNSVALASGVALIGARYDDDHGSNSGSAYVFRRGDDGWLQEQKLAAADSAAGLRFGSSVATDGNTAVVGALAESGSAYVFTHDEALGWLQQARLVADDGEPNDRFGTNVSLSGDTILVGAPGDDDNGSSSGSAYVFRLGPDGWVQEAKLTPADGAYADNFGYHVALHDGLAAVGAGLADTPGVIRSGAAYVFRRHGAEWVEEVKLFASDAAHLDHFGPVDVEADTVIVGSTGAEGAYVFRRISGSWVETDKLVTADGLYGDLIGYAVAVSGRTFVLGGPGVGIGGAVYVRELNEGYDRHGDHAVQVTAVDDSGNSTSVETHFTIDLGPPRVRILRTPRIRPIPPPGARAFSFDLPISETFAADDEDGAAGGVVRERILLDDCVLVDGSTFGDADGLLSDESSHVGRVELCQAAVRCGIAAFVDPEMIVEATDCGGNVAVASAHLTLNVPLLPGICTRPVEGWPQGRRRPSRVRAPEPD